MAHSRQSSVPPADKADPPMAAGKAPPDMGTKAKFINYPEPQLGYAPFAVLPRAPPESTDTCTQARSALPE